MEDNKNTKESKFKLVELEDVKDVLGGAEGDKASAEGSLLLGARPTTMCAW